MQIAQDKQSLAASVAQIIATVEQHIGGTHPHMVRTFRQCYPNALETTTDVLDDGTTFVISGDIPAMWLRDASAQVRTYVKLAATEPAFRRLVVGLIRRQSMYILIDAYANAFNKAPNGRGHQRDRTSMGPWIWERKFELDSLCYHIQL